MSHRTIFAGLAAPDSGESTQVLNGDFIYRNPDLTDQFLRIGALTHHHDGHLALANPQTAGTAVAVGSSGRLPADTYYGTYTLKDRFGGETLGAPVGSAVAGDGVLPPSFAPSGTVDYTGGILPDGNYAYALTYTDGNGGETTLGPVVWMTVSPGFASAQVDFTGLNAQLVSNGGAAIDWRLWRSYDGADWHLVTQSDASAFVDSGFDPPDNPARPPAVNTTGGVNEILFTIPTAVAEPAMASATGINVYFGTDPTLASPSLYSTLPIACAGITLDITDFVVSTGQPPPVSTSIPGAAQINPDTDILDWHWKRPKATSTALGSGELGDVRMTLDTGHLWGVLNPSGAVTYTDWTDLLTVVTDNDPADNDFFIASAGGGSARVGTGELDFVGSGVTTVAVTDRGGGSATVTISAPAGAVGPSGAVGGQGPPGAGVGAGGSGMTPLIAPLSYLEFAASAGVDVAIQTLGGGSARVLIGLPNIENASTQASGYAFQSSDVGAAVESASAATAVGWLINPYSQTPLPVGAVIELFQYGTGAVQVVASGNVVIRSDGGKTHLGGQFATGGLRQRAIDEWVLSGDLS